MVLLLVIPQQLLVVPGLKVTLGWASINVFYSMDGRDIEDKDKRDVEDVLWSMKGRGRGRWENERDSYPHRALVSPH